jgi:glycosyltransferase involved in cell wall biosynthesis
VTVARTADVAVVVPVYNDPAGIETTLESLCERGLDTVAVVDNGSTDGTGAVADSYAAAHDAVEHYVETAVQSSYAARNTGIRHTDADVVAFVDADVRVADDYVERALACMDRGGLDYVGCHVDLSIEGESTFAARYNAHTGFPVEQYLERHRYAPTCSLVVRREVFADVGLFDPRLLSGGDMEFGNRVDAAGYEMGYCADAVATHPVRDTVRSLYDKNVRVGRGHCQLQRYYPERYGEPPIPPRHDPLDVDVPALSLRDRFAFGSLSAAMTVARASGYARELMSPSDTGADVDGPPPL